MDYVDGYVLAVPQDKREDYRKLAELGALVFRDHGALQVVECWGEDVPEGKLTSFPMAVKLEPGEVVVFAWVRWPDKATRDAGMKAAFEDPRMHAYGTTMPFDGKRMIFGGFDVLVEG